MNIIEKIKELNLPLGQYVVVAGGVMAVLGIRDASDIDIAVMPDLHEKLRKTGRWQEEERYGKIFLKDDIFEINPKLDWQDYSTTTQEAIDSAIIIDGVPFMSLEELKKFKYALGRGKDFEDIRLIDKYLSEKQN